ncbi:MAG TPA: L,D-transpeptidase/peptidoglycan binding protein [Solirubrobacteraceae bacterium]|nr:L,D-transpeptidase/peptidoglycan binding protein [Solirubrobacteraceae bacterium]
MKRGPFIAAVGLLALLLVLCATAYAYDALQPQRMAAGLRVNGVDIGGLTRAQAQAKLSAELLQPLQHPVTILLPSGKPVRLGPRSAQVRMDLGTAVARAARLSRQGSIFDRVWRDVTGGRLHQPLTASLSYSRAAVAATVRRVAARVDRDPRDASVAPQGGRLVTTPGHDGAAVQRGALRRALVRRLMHADGSDRVRVPVRRLRPDVTQADLPAQYPSYIVVDRNAFELHLFKNLELAHTYTIAVGQQGLETPAGLYDIQDKQVDPTWHVPESDWAGDLAGKTVAPGPDDPLKARWMGFDGSAGIHGTAELDSLGSAASHGCIRMAVPDVENLYDQVSVGTPVYIE